MAPLGRLSLVIRFGFTGTAMTAIHITADPDRLQAFDITLDGPPELQADAGTPC